MNALEEGTEIRLDFKKLGSIADKGLDVVPVVLQHARTGDVLFIGYANELALGRRWSAVRPSCGQPHATSCGTRERPRATCSTWSRCVSTASRTLCCTA